ncbi:MAG: hypothetical protein AB1483_07220 [Candidatus Zixiibacteriota bacterium]
MLNLLAALIMLAAGVYIHTVFEPVLSILARTSVWIGVLTYMVLQVEFGYHPIQKHIEELLR